MKRPPAHNRRKYSHPILNESQNVIIMLPSEVMFHPDLCLMDMKVWWLMMMWDGQDGCFACNQKMAEELNTAVRVIQKSRAKLVEHGFIKSYFNAGIGRKGRMVDRININAISQYEKMVDIWLGKKGDESP